MKLATQHNGTRDGALVLISRDLSRWVSAEDIAPTLQNALDRWDIVYPDLADRSTALNAGGITGSSTEKLEFRSPLPRAYEWIDGSAYLNHVALVRRARGAEMPSSFLEDPLIYQGGSGTFLDPYSNIVLDKQELGCDFEAEIAVILGDTPQGVDATAALGCIKLITLVNDITLRNLIPSELAKGFGFFQSKPSSAFAPVAVTPDELSHYWRNGRLHLPLSVWWNEERVGHADAGVEMHFGFGQLISHITRTRSFTAGTILGSGTVSSTNAEEGYSCIVEKRTREQLEYGEPKTRYLQAGDVVRIEMLDESGASIFGPIEQKVVLS